MSKPSKSPSQAKSSSSVGSVCPPTARSLSLLTAEPPSQLIPTAMSNSVNTAIGATPSEFESGSGLSDTSAGSGRVSSAATTPKTAQAPTSPEILMNDLRRGSLFGRQSLNRSQEPKEGNPQSITNVTFSGTNATKMSTFDMSTADQMSMKSGTSESIKTGIPVSGSAGEDKSRRRSPAVRISQLKLKEEKHKQLESTTSPAILSKKSKKSRKSKKSAKKLKKTSEDSGKSMKTGISQKSTKSGKLGKKKAPEGGFSMDADFSKKSAKSKKSMKKADQAPQFGQSGVVKKGDKSTYLPGVMNGGPPVNKFMKKEGAESQKVQKVPNPRKFNETPAYNFPGTGKCTRSMDQVAPPTSQNAHNQSHVVYDVAQLPEAQRRVQGRSSAPPKCNDGRPMKKKTLFGAQSHYAKGPNSPSVSRKSAAPAAPTRIQAPTENKIVVFGKTPDGKTTVQMTIDMKVIAGEALNGSDKPATLIPKKVIVGGKEIKIDSESKSESGESP